MKLPPLLYRLKCLTISTSLTTYLHAYRARYGARPRPSASTTLIECYDNIVLSRVPALQPDQLTYEVRECSILA